VRQESSGLLYEALSSAKSLFERFKDAPDLS